LRQPRARARARVQVRQYSALRGRPGGGLLVREAVPRGRRGRDRRDRMIAGMGVALRVAFGALREDYERKRAAIDAAIERVLASGWFILGDEVARFEEEFARFLGVEHVVACANGTEAIALALQAAGLRPGDEVLLPANTCGPTLAGARLAGAAPRLCDVD